MVFISAVVTAEVKEVNVKVDDVVSSRKTSSIMLQGQLDNESRTLEYIYI